MISHTPNSLLEKQVKQLKEELEIRVQLINSLRIQVLELQKKQKPITKSGDNKKIEDLTNTLHRQNALITELRVGVTSQQAKALNTKAVNALLEKNQKLEKQLFAANEKLLAYKKLKLNSSIQEVVNTKKIASELAKIIESALDEASPSIAVKDYIERTMKTMSKTGNLSSLEHFFIQAIEGFENKALELIRQKKSNYDKRIFL